MARLTLLSVLLGGLLALATANAAARARTTGPPAPGACPLPGLVRVGPTRSARPCPDNGSTPSLAVRSGPPVATARADFLGGIVSLASGGIAGGVATTVAGSALGLGLTGIVHWVLDSAAAGLRETATLIGSSTRPRLEAPWFSATYWRVAGIALLLTLPFLAAAAVHALVRSDLALLGRAALGYLPLAVLAVYLAAPLATLLLSATDVMCDLVAGASDHAESVFAVRAAARLTAGAAVTGDPFLACLVGVITVLATLTLWLELLIRDAAVDVVVLMLPLVFAAMVWPARRTWAIRAVETLFALILAKFAIVCVLGLGGLAISGAGSGPAAILTGATLVLLATLTPWALLRLLPLHEVAAAAAAGLSDGPRRAINTAHDHARRFNGGRGAAPEEADAEPAEADVEGEHLARLRMIAGSRYDARRPGRGGGGGGDGGDGGDGAHRPGSAGPDEPPDPAGPTGPGGLAVPGGLAGPGEPTGGSSPSGDARGPINPELAPGPRPGLPELEIGDRMFDDPDPSPADPPPADPRPVDPPPALEGPPVVDLPPESGDRGTAG